MDLFVPYVFLAILTLMMLRAAYVMFNTENDFGVVLFCLVSGLISGFSCYKLVMVQTALNRCSF